MKKYGLSILFILLLVLPVMAQKRKVPQLTPEQIEYQAKVERMTANTQRVMFIDSVVVDKQQFLEAYRLVPEVGQITRYQDFFHTNEQPNAYVFLNELGNRCFLSCENNDSTINLYQAETIDNHWSRPTPLKGINDDGQFRRVNYPFMMGDGQTFYFAAEGGEGLGGYDIYVTRYDAEGNQFLHPANIGMPFNSEANDYLYVVDEYNNLGWFATDRNQPDEKVCVYVFEPSNVRQTYDSTAFTTEEMARYARIENIADTWTDSLALRQARQRLQTIRQPKAEKPTTNNLYFVVNDSIVYTRLSDFKSADNVGRYQQLTSLRDRYQQLLTTLECARDYYATATHAEQEILQQEILAAEQKQYGLYSEIHQLEKTIRNEENIFLTINN